jgi:heptosyltransferase I
MMATPRLPFAEPPESLCVLRLSALGDVCHMVPVVNSIRSEWPGTRITWCIAGPGHLLVGDLPGVEFVVFDKARGLAGYADLRRGLRGRRFDALVQAQVSLRSNIAGLAVRAPVRLGYDRARARDLHGLFVNERIPPGPGQHVLDSFFDFAAALGVTRRELRWDIPVPAEDAAFAERMLPDGARYLLISPCSSHPRRNWLADRYAAVADHARRRYGLEVVLVGGASASEHAMGQAIARRMTVPPLNLIGRDTVKRLLALLARAELLISPDSGPMHMATAVGTPVVGLHAASNPARSGPYLSQEWCVNRYDDAARKFLGRPADALEWGTKIELDGVMQLVTVADATERLDALMENRQRTAAGTAAGSSRPASEAEHERT